MATINVNYLLRADSLRTVSICANALRCLRKVAVLSWPIEIEIMATLYVNGLITLKEIKQALARTLFADVKRILYKGKHTISQSAQIKN